MIYFDENNIVLHHGDCRAVLATLPEQSVHCCVTSPPYFGLRDYGVDGQIGLEPTVEAYVAEMVAVFAGVWRVLRDDGTLWLNLGDSYSGSGKGGNPGEGWKQNANAGSQTVRGRVTNAVKKKEIIGIPWRVAFALQAAGWYLRNDIIWAKPGPMPESVTDRCTKSHEYIFLLTKKPHYYFNADAIKEPCVESNAARPRMGQGENTQYEQKWASWNGSEFHTGKTAEHQLGRSQKQRKPAGWDTSKGDGGHGTFHKDGRAKEVEYSETKGEFRTKRDVWTVASAPYKEAHFATFPPKLIEPCIKAGVPPGGICLDPFFGAGTTGLVCQQQHVRCVGIELNEKYCAIAKKRLQQGVLTYA